MSPNCHLGNTGAPAATPNAARCQPHVRTFAALCGVVLASFAIVQFYAFQTPNSSFKVIAPDSQLADGRYRRSVAEPERLQLNSDGIAKSSNFPPYDVIDRKLEADLCFFLQLSESSLPLAPRLLARLWHPRNVVLVHIDAKVPHHAVAEFQAVLETAGGKYDNVHITPRETITYAGISMLLNTLAAMEFALRLPQPWDYFINLSGSDYPVLSVRDMRILFGQPRILRQRVSFLQLSRFDFWAGTKRDRFNRFVVDPALGLPLGSKEPTELVMMPKSNPAAPTLKGPLPHSQGWVTAHRTMVAEATRGVYARHLLPLLANTLAPDEHFFAMLAWNTPLNHTTAHYAGRIIFWTHKGKKKWHHPHDVDTDPEGFWPGMELSPGLFARKFKVPDSPLMDRIDRELSGVAKQINVTSVNAKRRRVYDAAMCSADIELQSTKSVINYCMHRK